MTASGNEISSIPLLKSGRIEFAKLLWERFFSAGDALPPKQPTYIVIMPLFPVTCFSTVYIGRVLVSRTDVEVTREERMSLIFSDMNILNTPCKASYSLDKHVIQFSIENVALYN